MKALILAGGLGTRLRAVVPDMPKPMALLAGKPFLEHQIRFLKGYGISEIVLAVSYMSDKIKSYFGDGRHFGVSILYSDEDSPLGTGGAIKNAEEYLGEDFLVMNGDTYSPIDLQRFMDSHKKGNYPFSVCLKETDNTSTYGRVELEGNRIVRFSEKKEAGRGLINRGIYILNSKIFEYIEKNKKVSLEHEIFPLLADKGFLYGYTDNSYFMDIGLPETYNKIKSDILKGIFISEDTTLIESLKKIKESGINLCLVVSKEKDLVGSVNSSIIEDSLLEGISLNSSVARVMNKNPATASIHDSKEKIKEILMSGVDILVVLDDDKKVHGLEFKVENLEAKSFPIIRGRSPLRISFSGGGTDVPMFFEKYSGNVINVTIDKYCYLTIKKRADLAVTINSDLIDKKYTFYVNNITYDGNLDMIKAIVKLMDVDFGLDIISRNDIPPGRGLGSSASFATLLVKMLANIQGLNYDNYKIAEIAFKAEREILGIKGGWQDQFASVMGGFNFMEFSKDKKVIYPLKLTKETINELNERLFLCYVGKSRDSGKIHTKQEDNFKRNEEDLVKNLNNVRDIAIKIKDSLLTNDLDQIGELLNSAWLNKKHFASSISDGKIDYLYNLGINNGAIGGKLLGAGGGGYLLFYFKPENRNGLKATLEKAGAEIVNFKFENSGIETWFA